VSWQNGFRYGVWYAWYGNVNYEWQYFLVASCSSVGGMLLWIAASQLIKK
jgi:hypothetical protein